MEKDPFVNCAELLFYGNIFFEGFRANIWGLSNLLRPDRTHPFLFIQSSEGYL